MAAEVEAVLELRLAVEGLKLREFVFGARAGDRTLNLGIKSHLTRRLLASQGVSGRLSSIRTLTQASHSVSSCVRESHSEGINEGTEPAVMTGRPSSTIKRSP